MEGSTGSATVYVYCGEAWRLAALGHESANRPSRDAGTVHHARKATAERAAGVSIAAGRILVVLAILAFIVFLQFFTRYIMNDSLAWTSSELT